MSSQDAEDDYEIPFNHKRPFGAGIKRKRIEFVPQSAATGETTTVQEDPAPSAHDKYLSIVFSSADNRKDAPYEPLTNTSQIDQTSSSSDPPSLLSSADTNPVCKVCKLPISTTAETNQIPHEATLVHQVCVEHSYPPSALDRRRKGLAYLASYGWDPDSRTGLGASGEGRLYPIRAEKKDDNRGIGAAAPQKQEPKKSVLKNGKEFKKAQQEAKQREARLRDLVYGRDDVNKYLGIEL